MRRRFALPIIPLLLAGCAGPLPPDAEPVEAAPALATAFDPAGCGTVRGRVVWDGPIPTFPPISVGIPIEGGVQYRHYPNPNAPHISADTRAVAGVVIYLESVDAARSRPWDHPPLRVEIHDAAIRVVQGDAVRNIGFSHRGDEVEMVSREATFHALSARGAAFFSLTFPEPDRPLRRKFDKPGLVDFTSAATKHWHQAYLFVADHPYFTVTDGDGRFTLPLVPAGDYRVVCWLPDGTLHGIDRDPNFGGELRRHYAPPLERRRPATVISGADAAVNFRLER